MKPIFAALLALALIAPATVWAQFGSCDSDPKEITVDQTWQRVNKGVGVEFQSRFDFSIPDAVSYRLEVTEFNINTSPATLGRIFDYDAKNPPTTVDEFQLHPISIGSAAGLGVILFTGSANSANSAAIAQLTDYYSGIRGKAVVTFECEETVEVGVIATAATSGSGDTLTATYTATLENAGTKAANNVQLVVTLPPEVHVERASDSRCVPDGAFAGGSVTCSGISLAGKDDSLGRNTEFIDIITRVLNASELDRDDKATMTITVPEDINTANNEDTTSITPQLVGTVADTEEAMAALDPYFNYLARPALNLGQCDAYPDDIFERLEALRAERPELFRNLAYAKISSGGGENAGHAGVVVYAKGSDYKTAGVVIHGTPTWSPVDADSSTRRGAASRGAHAAAASWFGQGTASHGMYYRTPVNNFPGTPTPAGPVGCGFEGVYPDNVGSFANGANAPQCGASSPPQSCPVVPDAVVVRTESPVNIELTNSRAQRLQTSGGTIVTQELGARVYSYPTQHADGTYGWVLVLPKDNYDIKLVGTAQGSYKLTTVNYGANGQANATTYDGTTSNGQLNDYKIAAAAPQAAPAPAPVPPPTAQSSSGGGGGSTNPVVLLALFLTLLAGRRLQAAGRRSILA